MTTDNFKEKIQKPHKADDTINYIACFFFIGLGLYFLIKIFLEFDSFPDIAKFLVFILPLFFLSAGIYGLWRLKNTYAVRQIYSTQVIERKAEAVELYLKQLNVQFKRQDDNFISLRYRNKYLTSIDAQIYYDDNKILYYAEGADLNGIRGIIDFGVSKRAMRRIERHFKAYL